MCKGLFLQRFLFLFGNPACLLVDKPENNDSEELDKELEQKLEEDIDTEVAEEIDLEFLQAENQRLKEEFLRAYADAENTKKRCAQEIEKNNK